jgi:cytochrome c2
MDMTVRRAISARITTKPLEDAMGVRFGSTFLFSLLLFSLPAAYADDASEGRDLFLRQCLGCHAFACNKEGPRLGGLFGRKAGTAEGYDGYSQGLRDLGTEWSGETLDKWLTDPGKIVPGSVMALNGKVEDAANRRKIIAFLKTEDPTVNICPQ